MSSLFQWIEQSWLGTAVNNSLWAFAAFEAVHAYNWFAPVS